MTLERYCFIVQMSQQDHKKSITPHLLNAAKALIPKFWKEQKIPSLCQWLTEVGRIYQMENSTLKLKNKVELASKI